MQSIGLWLLSPAILPVTLAMAGETTNLLRNPGFENGTEAWSLPPTFSVVSDAAHRGTCSLRLVNANAATYLLAQQPVPFQPGPRYRYGAWIKTRAVTGDESGATLCMERSGARGWIGGSYADGKKGDLDWFHVEGVTAPIPTNATSVAVELYLRQGMTGTAWFDDVTVVEEYPPPLDCVMLRPNYRGRLAVEATDQRVRMRARVGQVLKDGLNPEQARLEAVILSRAGKVAARVSAGARAGDNDLALDAGTLPAGDYQVRVELLTPGGASLASQESGLHKVLPTSAPPAVSVDEHNRTIVKGKPFFPLGWYFGPGPTDPKFREHLDRISASPFNTIMCYGLSYYSYGDLLRDTKAGFDQRWADMLVLAQEAEQLSAALLSPAPPPPIKVKAPSPVHDAVRSDERGGACVLLANPGTAPAPVRVLVPKRAALRLLQRGEERPVERDGSRDDCELTVPPMGALTLGVESSS